MNVLFDIFGLIRVTSDGIFAIIKKETLDSCVTLCYTYLLYFSHYSYTDLHMYELHDAAEAVTWTSEKSKTAKFNDNVTSILCRFI